MVLCSTTSDTFFIKPWCCNSSDSNVCFKLVDDYKIDGDFIESQAFAFLAIRSMLKLPISFPNTTGCLKPCTGGELIKN